MSLQKSRFFECFYSEKMAESFEDVILEEREEVMVSPTGGNPTLRNAHFLKPIVTSIDGPPLKLSSLSLSSESEWPLKVSFNGWRDPLLKWKTWVDRMHSLYQYVWKEAGIYEAIMGSTYKIYRNYYLVFGLAERWCWETKTFVFPWGEATITLEDMMILGGFSVLGAPVSKPLETQELVEIEENLKQAHKDLVKSKSQKAHHFQWINCFMGTGSKFEHVAFLSLWLSRFVFPGNGYNTVGKYVFPIAIHLARGTRIALAPPVLASLYRDLSLLKEAISASAELGGDESENSFLALSVWAPLALVQIWGWERLPPLQPKPNFLNFGDPRLARWHQMKKLNIGNVRLAIDSSADSFLWRPYAIAVDNWLMPKFYKEKEEWVSGNLVWDEEFESFARCLRVCELVGIDCIEQYLPHRVAMQFGMDQDLPGWVSQSDWTPEIAWQNYSRPIRDVKLYIPPRLFESDVTIQYAQWWKQSVLAPQDAITGVVRRPRTLRRSKRLCNISERMKGGNEADVPPKRVDIGGNQNTMLHNLKGWKGINNADVPSDFPPMCVDVEGNQNTQLQNLKGRKGSNNADGPPGFPPMCVDVEGNQNTLLQNLKGRKGSNNADVPPGFPPMCVDVEGNQNTLLQNLKGRKGGNNADVPPGFPPMCVDVEGNQNTPLQNLKGRKGGNNADVPPGFLPMCVDVEGNQNTLLQNLEGRKGGNDADVPPGFPPKRVNVEENQHTSLHNFRDRKGGSDAYVPPGFPPICVNIDGHQYTLLHKLKEMKGAINVDVPPGFMPKPASGVENLQNPVGILQAKNKHHSGEERLTCNDKHFLAAQFQFLSSSTASNGDFVRESLMKPGEKIKQAEAATVKSETGIEHENQSKAGSSIHCTISINPKKAKAVALLLLTYRRWNLRIELANLREWLAEIADRKEDELLFAFHVRRKTLEKVIGKKHSGSHRRPSDWNSRMIIAEGAARGLEYLHETANPPVIYRDFTVSNIPEIHHSVKVFQNCDESLALKFTMLPILKAQTFVQKTKRKFDVLADPLPEGNFYPIRGPYQALAIAAMCLQEEASVQPLVSNIVTTLEYLFISKIDEAVGAEMTRIVLELDN
ncbi:unnamed protein product [Ilex paraguariensis]|uniref:Aminotransferase-like plant mobile domain-containing protein n=1 Tax=Ilex paraguariensis TaxID=185542 RepID=A0ABC8UGI1_9AQUA